MSPVETPDTQQNHVLTVKSTMMVGKEKERYVLRTSLLALAATVTWIIQLFM